MSRREREKEFFRPLPNGDAIRVRFDATRGAVGAFTAQYEVWADGAWRPAVRYDSAHGRPHRDTLDWAGNVVAKNWLPEGTSPNDALTIAEHDFKANADRHRDEFLRRKP
ncbi:MAG: hypothetical protein M3Q10_12455 [Chloroflexota bacterium]|nr:hypothetical protein [Chloroflexota bacterium]